MSKAARKQDAAARWRRWEGGVQVEKRWQERKAALRQALMWSKDAGPQPSPPPFTTTGVKVGLTLLVDFDDDPATIPQAEIVDFCNGEYYTGFLNNGSVKKYFQEISNNLLIYTNVVTVYIRIPNSLHPKSWYNAPTNDCGGQANLLVRDALNVLTGLPNYATEILPNFANLTVDETNQVVACNVFYAGAHSGVWNMGLWPHSWSLAEVGPQELAPGGKKIWNYQVSNIGSSLQLGTFCHETGHMLCGFPDIYDYDAGPEASAGGAGNFCLMNSGGRGGNPVQVCAYLKRAAGWATTTELYSSSELTATASAGPGPNFNHFYRYQKPGAPTEYFLAECRHASGRDATLPGSGLAIWHIDELGDHNNQSLAPNMNHSNYEVTLMQADNLWHFQSNANSGDVHDLFFSENTALSYSNFFSDASLPSALWWDGSPSGIYFHEFSGRAAVMSFVAGTPEMIPQIVTQPLDQTVIAYHPASFSVTAIGNAPMSYQWHLNDSPIQGATSARFVLPSAEGRHSGRYFVIVTNPLGSARSREALLTVHPPISIAEALDTTNLLWTSGGDAVWQSAVDTTYDGVDAAISGGIGDGQESWIETTIANGPGTVRFWWKVESEGQVDLLEFQVDGVRRELISGQAGWEQRTCAISGGTHVLRWRYSKDPSVSSGRDAAWLDEVSFTPGTILPPPDLAEALDLRGLDWSSGGSASWFGQRTMTFDGIDATQNGTITDNEESWLQTSLEGPGTLSFWWKVSSEANYDFFLFQIDGGEPLKRISGEVNWSTDTIHLSQGNHLLRWTYVKDWSKSTGEDRAWLDQIGFVPDVLQAPRLTSATKLLDGSFGFNVIGSIGGTYVVIGSTDMAVWMPLATNIAPFIFQDPDHPEQRFKAYRAFGWYRPLK